MSSLLKSMLNTLKSQRGAIGIYFDGRRLIRPQAVTKIDDSGMFARGLGGANVLALIGECTGGKPKTIQWFTDPSYAKAILKSGNLLKAVQRAYAPSAEVSGAYTVGVIRVNPAVQASLSITDVSYNPLMVLKSVDYGIWNNQIKVRVEPATNFSSIGGKKATVTFGQSYDQGDDIYRKSFYLGCADPAATTATFTITNGLTTKTLTTLINGSAGITVNLRDYPTIQELVDYLDAQPKYEAGAITTKPESESSLHLDDVTTANMMPGGNTTLSSGYSPSGVVLNVVSTSDFAIGDYVVVARANGSMEEIRRVIGISGGPTIIIDSALSTTYVTGSIVREAAIACSNVQALIDWFNNYSSYVSATDHGVPDIWLASTAYIKGEVVQPTTGGTVYIYECTTAGISGTTEPTWPSSGTVTDSGVTWTTRTGNRAVIANIGDTYLTGGSEGTTTQTNWNDAINTLQTEEVDLVSCVSVDPAVWAALSTHCSYMSTVGKKERIGFCGGFASADGYASGLGRWNNTTNILASLASMLNYAQQLNTDRMVYVAPGFTAYDENGLLTTYNGAISAALVAGMASGVDVATALTHKSVNVIGLEYNFKWSDLDRLLEGGVCPLSYDPGHGYRVEQSITSWLRSDKYNRRELSVRRTADFVARQVRDRLERDFVGSKGTMTTLISIKNATISVLTQMTRSELLAGDANNPPFKNIQVRLEGDTAYVDFECSPVIPINYIPITIHLTVFTTIVTA